MEVLTKSQIYQRNYYLKNRDKVLSRCRARKAIRSHQNAERYRRDRVRILATVKTYQEANRGKIRERMRRWVELNAHSLRKKKADHYARNRDIALAKAREYRIKNAKRLSQYQMEKRRRCPITKLKSRLRLRLSKALKLAGAARSARTMELVGCNATELKAHFERQFRDGMTWGNHGTVWHIDHKRPLASFNLLYPDEQRQAFHYTNLQPLLVVENLSKGARF